MRKLTLLLSLGLSLSAMAQSQTKTPPTLKSILLQQFQNTSNQQDWFVPVSKAVEGLTAQQAMWKPSDSSHSAGELAYHLLFWNKQILDKFYGRKPTAFDGNNNETFTAFTEASWASTVQQLNQVMQDWETAIKNSDDAKLQTWYDNIAHINTHNSFHPTHIPYILNLPRN